MLAYEWPEGQNPFDSDRETPTVGRRMKTMLADVYAYQRLPRHRIVNEALRYIHRKHPGRGFPSRVPPKVPVAYNMAYGDQKCKAVDDFPTGIRGRQRDIFAEYGETCAVPDAPGSGGGGDGMTTGTFFATDQPTYMPATWTGFSSATGSLWMPTDPGFEVTCATTGCPSSFTNNGTFTNAAPITATPINTTSISTANFTLTITSTISPSSSSSMTQSTTATTTDPSAPNPTVTSKPAPTDWTNALAISYAKDCEDALADCRARWFFFNAVSGKDFDVCRDVGDAIGAPGTPDWNIDPALYPNETITLPNVTGQTGCWYEGTSTDQPGVLSCDGFLGEGPIQCIDYYNQTQYWAWCDTNPQAQWSQWKSKLLVWCQWRA